MDARTETRDGPSLFVGIELEVNEIILCRNRINDASTALKAGYVDRYEAAVKQAADEIATAAAQMSTLAAHLSGVIARHQNRKPRA